MIPLKDVNPSFRFPWINLILIGLNLLFFFGELFMGKTYLESFISYFGFVPERLFSGLLFAQGFFLGLVPFFSSLFLHGGWFHLLGNMLYLWIFGDNVEDVFGHFAYLLFYLFCGVFATLIHSFVHSNSDLPVIGASGAIAGVLGAYLVLFPRAKVLTLVPIGIFLQFIELPAFILLLFWVLFQFLQGFVSLLGTGGGVAWWAHIGGFLAGILIALPFRNKVKKRSIRY